MRSDPFDFDVPSIHFGLVEFDVVDFDVRDILDVKLLCCSHHHLLIDTSVPPGSCISASVTNTPKALTVTITHNMSSMLTRQASANVAVVFCGVRGSQNRARVGKAIAIQTSTYV